MLDDALFEAAQEARARRLRRELSALRTEDEMGVALERAAVFLADLPATWAATSQEQRNALARLHFKEVRIKNEWVVAVEPQPTFAPFFALDCQAWRLSGGSDGDYLH
ncbi:MAG TPA: hypothetical protein VFW96_09610 [Thermomicrobiales bacterium]|nr:hypothetical protein [Thermomicrobiales bacterium]